MGTTRDARDAGETFPVPPRRAQRKPHTRDAATRPHRRIGTQQTAAPPQKTLTHDSATAQRPQIAIYNIYWDY